ncbi:MarR family transcriptional regulator [bacterium]|nr:MAG: MarR family transcriptional regulator [bacterium]MCL4231529.1 winged helix DNA-binding protein [Dehalococcoidia bacterium]
MGNVSVGATRELDLVASLYRTTNAFVRELDRRLVQEDDVTFIQAITLLAIDSFDRPQPRLVADFLSQQSQTVTGVLDRLERAGHVRRLRDMEDRRAVRLQLTDSGKRIARAIEGRLQQHVADLLAGVDSPTRARLQLVLESLESSVRVGSANGL